MKLYKLRNDPEIIQYKLRDIYGGYILKAVWTPLRIFGKYEKDWRKRSSTAQTIAHEHLVNYLEEIFEKLLEGKEVKISDKVRIRIAAVENKHTRNYRYDPQTFGDVFRPVIILSAKRHRRFYAIKFLGEWARRFEEKLKQGMEYGGV